MSDPFTSNRLASTSTAVPFSRRLATRVDVAGLKVPQISNERQRVKDEIDNIFFSRSWEEGLLPMKEEQAEAGSVFPLRFGAESEALRAELALLANLLANEHPPWASYRALMACRLVALDKQTGRPHIGYRRNLPPLDSQVRLGCCWTSSDGGGWQP